MHNKVIDSQRVFRKILDSLSRPGKIVALDTTFAYRTTLLDETMDILMTLLDREVTFHLLGEDAATTEEIEIRTLARASRLEDADYIIIPKATEQTGLAVAFRQGKRGTLLDPNHNATVILESEAISTDASYVLSGPGVRDCQWVSIAAADSWIAARNEAVAEFPLGIDCFIVDQGGSCIGLPRTTVLEGVN